MKYVHNVTLSVFSPESEDQDKVIAAFESFLSLNYEEEKVDIKITNAESHDHSILYTYSFKIKRQKHIRLFFATLWSRLDDAEKEKIKELRLSRIDEQACFFLRFDKQAALGDSLKLTDSGQCFHIRIKIAAYPRNKENAQKLIMDMLEQLED